VDDVADADPAVDAVDDPGVLADVEALPPG
jgi:hypothetical protein